MENEKNSLNGVSGTWTDAQRKLLFKLMQENDLQTQDMEESLNFPMSDLSVREASQLIDCLKNKGNLSDVIGQIKEKRDNQSEPSNLNVPKSPEEAMKNKEKSIIPAAPINPVVNESFGIIQIGDMSISEQDIDQLSKIPRMLNRIYQSVMQEGTDYGVIPGAGDKPTLLKPGAEMLRMAFNLRYKTEIDTSIEDWNKGMFYYRIKTHFSNSKDQYVGTGIGSANSEETRYSNRWVVESDIPEGIDKVSLRSQEKLAKKGSKYKVYLIEADIHEKATLVNTLQKMAKKRSFVDGILSITGASRIFTQDVEDIVGGGKS